MPSVARAGDEQELEIARRQLDEFAYDKAATRLGRMLDPATPVCTASIEVTPDGCRLTDMAAVRRARGLYAIVLFTLKRPAEAKTQFKKLLLEDPTFSPSPADYPVDLIKLFAEAKKEHEDSAVQRTVQAQKAQKDYDDAVKLYDDWVDEMQMLASTESVVSQRSRWIAAIPFGVGQFQNDDVGLGVFFSSLEGALVVASIVTGAWQARLIECRAKVDVCSGDDDPIVVSELEDQIQTLQIVNLASVGLLGAAIIAGIIEAEVNFEPEIASPRARPVRTRPPKPVKPTVEVTSGPPNADIVGVGVGVHF